MENIRRIKQPHDINWNWVKGHSGNPENEKADALANLGIENLDK